MACYQAKAGRCNLLKLGIVSGTVLLNVPGETLFPSLLESGRVQADTRGNKVGTRNEGKKEDFWKKILTCASRNEELFK